MYNLCSSDKLTWRNTAFVFPTHCHSAIWTTRVSEILCSWTGFQWTFYLEGLCDLVGIAKDQTTGMSLCISCTWEPDQKVGGRIVGDIETLLQPVGRVCVYRRLELAEPGHWQWRHTSFILIELTHCLAAVVYGCRNVEIESFDSISTYSHREYSSLVCGHCSCTTSSKQNMCFGSGFVGVTYIYQWIDI